MTFFLTLLAEFPSPWTLTLVTFENAECFSLILLSLMFTCMVTLEVLYVNTKGEQIPNFSLI